MDSRLSELLAQMGLPDVSEAWWEYEKALYAANEVQNLTRVPREEAWLRHFVDSLLFHDLIPQDSTVLDLGTGPGLPAWPLAVARPDLTVTALDSNAKMLAFLDGRPLPNLKVLLGRAEESPNLLGRSDVVTGRALAPLSVQLELSVPMAKVGGLILPMRTPNDAAECERLREVLGAELVQLEVRELPILAAKRSVPVYAKRTRSPKGYPRQWAAIRKKPL